MSASCDDNEPFNDGRLKHTPKKESPPKQNPNNGPVRASAAPPHVTKKSSKPQWKRAKKRGAFVGDLDIVELRNQLARGADRIPEPPLSDSSLLTTIGRLAGVIAVVTICAVGYRWAFAPSDPPTQRQMASGAANVNVAVPESAGHLNASNRNDRQPDGRDAPNVMTPTEPAQRSAWLLVNAERVRPIDEPAQLAISAVGAGANAAVVIAGLPSGSAVSAGNLVGPSTWRVPFENLRDAAVTPPRGFVGVMDLTLELRLADDTVVDRKGLELEWSGKSVLASAKSSQRSLDAAEIALMIKSGEEFMANGNVGAARLMFQPAAEAGEALAAFALAETYDPLVLEKLGAKGGITADIALAQKWYEKARDLGSTAAPDRLVALARRPE